MNKSKKILSKDVDIFINNNELYYICLNANTIVDENAYGFQLDLLQHI